MKLVIPSLFFLCALAACASSAPPTAWGKLGVSMLDYRIDAGQCAIIAASSEPIDSATHIAGGIHGQNPSPPKDDRIKTAGTNPNADQKADAGRAHSTSDGMYRESASADFVSRAATQQRTQQMLAQRARVARLHQCLAGRGYTEFRLTSEERAQLKLLPEGSEERRNFLYGLGTDPKVLNRGLHN